MTYRAFLEYSNAWASILTAAVAVFAYGSYRLQRREKRRRLEEYLRAEKAKGKDKGQRTLTHLVANLGMSETDILDCAFRSKHVDRRIDERDGKAIGLFLEYKP